MSNYPSMEASSDSSMVPSASEFTSRSLRNCVRVELDAPVSEVREPDGRSLPVSEYSVGLERVDAKQDDHGKCIDYMRYFEPLEEGPRVPRAVTS